MILEKETEAILSCAMEVSNTLGHGFHEKPYENALAVEMRLRGIHVVQQPRFDVVYKEVKVGEYFPDLIAFEKVIIDTKDHRTNHGPRTWPNAKLPASHWSSRWIDHQFQTREDNLEARRQHQEQLI